MSSMGGDGVNKTQIIELFKKLDKSGGTKKEYIAAGTDKIPCNCYRLPNGVIVAQTTTVLGAGANGTVFQGIDIKSGTLYAIKIPKNNEENIEDFKKINDKMKRGNKLMASVDISRNSHHAGMYHTMNIDGLEIAIMPKLKGEQLASLIKAHADLLNSVKPNKNKQQERPQQPQRIEEKYSMESSSMVAVDRDGDIGFKTENIYINDGNDPQSLYSIKDYKERHKHKTSAELYGYLGRVANMLRSGGYLETVSDSKHITMLKDKVDAHLPDQIIKAATKSYGEHREEKVVIDDPDEFIQKLSQIIKDLRDACMDNAALVRGGAINRDIKPENMIRDNLGATTTMDYDEADNLKPASEVIFGKEHIARGSPYYLSPYNKAVYNHLENDIRYINAAVEALGVYELLKEQDKLTEELTMPGGMFSDENLALLRVLADPPDYIWNAQSEANAIGISAEELSQTCFKQVLLKKYGGGMPNKLISETEDPYVAAFNKFLKITKKLINPDVANTYVAADAVKDFELLGQRLEALTEVRQQLKNPQPMQHSTLSRKITGRVRPYLPPAGVIANTTTNMTHQSPAWDNVIQTLAVDLDPTKHKIEVNADKSVTIKNKITKKLLGSLSLFEGNVYGTTSDADAFEQMLKVYIASHKAGETVKIQIVGLADNPQQALNFASIAKNLAVEFTYDDGTHQAVMQYQASNNANKNRHNL